jgi:hypothetical protein
MMFSDHRIFRVHLGIPESRGTWRLKQKSMRLIYIYGAYMVSINVSINEKNYVFNPHGSPFWILESLGFSDFSKMEFTLTELFSK